MEPVNPPPGWYPDPDGRTGTKRFWNGSAWTGQYHPLPAKPQPPAKAPVRKKWYMNRWLWAAAGVVVLIIAASSTGGSKSPEKKKAATSQAPLIDRTKLARAARTREPFEAMQGQRVASDAQMAKLATAAVRAASHDRSAIVKVVESDMTPTNLAPAVTADYMGGLADGDLDAPKKWHTYELLSAYGTGGEWNVLVTTKKGKVVFVNDPRVYPPDSFGNLSWSDPENYGADAPARPPTPAQVNYATGPLPRR